MSLMELCLRNSSVWKNNGGPIIDVSQTFKQYLTMCGAGLVILPLTVLGIGEGRDLTPKFNRNTNVQI